MTDPADPHATHIPDHVGRPICGTPGGRTTVVGFPTCPTCRSRMTPPGMKPKDALNPAHPLGRIIVGSAFGLPGFPDIPGVPDLSRGDDD